MVITNKRELISVVIGFSFLMTFILTFGLYIGYHLGINEIPQCKELPAHILHSTSLIEGNIHCHYEVNRTMQRDPNLFKKQTPKPKLSM